MEHFNNIAGFQYNRRSPGHHYGESWSMSNLRALTVRFGSHIIGRCHN